MPIKLVDVVRFENTPKMYWEYEVSVWTIRVHWDGTSPVTYQKLTTQVTEGGFCRKSILDECMNTTYGYAWKEVRRRASFNKDQLSLPF